ncbi:MAG: hypothetical protein AUK07_01965 [Parcubacteria group bacterium CG2_30_36_21]|uniref:Uncharacterized protein n=2 Tax=Candidatus Gribaldobacteria TaxID=2798536 RepID=A0A2M7VL83_9BACT|nr:MAG: hypothetical protein AUK07_01965 [Parcubacteria group bacterium CG2_30_36_21]PIR91178.1 MAG: hypothetical protein COU02_00960 [bacterium (Candidatus Gribaldobacteria) CG10_big_fil_rev_8_21_14_0_10_37_46]PJA02429.1 MAG: hypothetical protein COX73_00830 [bacterium (Candidatus Gribaldobacteria) CG_4_10_14_0_2_um_filter_36_18]
MGEKIKRILLWILFIWSVIGFIQILNNVINYHSIVETENLELEAEGIEIVRDPVVDIFINIIFLFLFGGFIYWIYRKLFPKKETKKETEEVGFLQRIKNWLLGLWKKIFK